MLLESSFEVPLCLSNVDLSAQARYFIYDVRLFSDGERIFDLIEHGPEREGKPTLMMLPYVAGISEKINDVPVSMISNYHQEQ